MQIDDIFFMGICWGTDYEFDLTSLAESYHVIEIPISDELRDSDWSSDGLRHANLI